MDPLGELIGQEFARRASVANARGAETLRAFGLEPPGEMGRGVANIGASVRSQVAPSSLERVAGAALSLVPKVGMLIRSVNAGPVADGTLEHARRMGWTR